MIYTLLAYPRSGSSLVRSIICYVTGLRPCQPGGHCELDDILGSYIVESKDKFYKFHKPVDYGHTIATSNNKLMMTFRDPLENIPSYLFSELHKKEGINKKSFSKDYMIKFFDDLPEGDLDRFITSYQTNLDFYNNWSGDKCIISYSKLLDDPVGYVFKELKSTFIPFIRHEPNDDYASLFEKVLAFKKGHKDPYKVNTSADNKIIFKEIIPKSWLDKLSVLDLPVS